ncbi:unnamed protein product, partial [Iphiclides podalirius]
MQNVKESRTGASPPRSRRLDPVYKGQPIAGGAARPRNKDGAEQKVRDAEQKERAAEQRSRRAEQKMRAGRGHNAVAPAGNTSGAALFRDTKGCYIDVL